MHGLPAYERCDLNIESRVKGRNGLADNLKNMLPLALILSPLRSECPVEHSLPTSSLWRWAWYTAPHGAAHFPECRLRDTQLNFLDHLSDRRLRGGDKEMAEYIMGIFVEAFHQRNRRHVTISSPIKQSFPLTRHRTILIFVFKDAKDASITATRMKDQRASARWTPIAGFTIVRW